MEKFSYLNNIYPYYFYKNLMINVLWLNRLFNNHYMKKNVRFKKK